MRPFDPRLLRYSRSARGFFVAQVIAGVAACAVIVCQAVALTAIVVPVFTAGANLDDVWPAVSWLAFAVAGRVLLAFTNEALALRAAAGAKSELREAAVGHMMRLGPAWLARNNSGRLTQLVTRGIDALDGYFARYLPQLLLAVMVPAVVTVVVFRADPTAAGIMAITVPLIPLFMILIGLHTKHRVDRQWRVLGVLSGHFADVVAGMSTLKTFGRERAQAGQVRRISDEYRRATLGVLRVSFLSSLVLELVSMLSIALVAVSIGVRLVDGTIPLEDGLLVLLLVPEVYLPLRMVGAHYHAAAEGVGAARQIMEILDEPVPVPLSLRAVHDLPGARAIPDLARSRILLQDVVVQFPDRGAPALDGVSMTIDSGTITALVGPSGSGKSTILALLEAFVSPTAGRITLEQMMPGSPAAHLEDIDPAVWRARVGWVGQVPRLVSGSLADNVRLAVPTASDSVVADALVAVGLVDLVASLPLGLETPVGDGGMPLSAGQTRRIAFARVLCADPDLVLLDEPTAALDGTAEDLLLDAIRRLAIGRTMVIVAHREPLVALADSVVRLAHGRVAMDPLVVAGGVR